MLTHSQLRAVMPQAGERAAVFLEPIVDTFHEFAINTPARQAAFLAQIAHESGELRSLEENLNYRAERLLEIFPGRFTDSEADAYEHHPQKIANRVYANRFGNGDEASGDGWRFRGRGLIGVTFRHNYWACGLALRVDLVANPDLLLQPVYAARSAGWFFQAHGCNELADKSLFRRISLAVNPGGAGLKARDEYLHVAMAKLGSGGPIA
jgi:putative chitinase